MNKRTRLCSALFMALLMLTISLSGCSQDSTTVSLQKDLALLNDTKKDLESRISDLENKNSDLAAKIEQQNKSLQDISSKLAELQKTLDEASVKSSPGTLSGSENTALETSGRLHLSPKTVYLTIDDGPSENTEKFLEVLKKYNVKATFFVNGNRGMLESYLEIIADGHGIGNHTYSHDYRLIYSSVDNFLKDMDELASLLGEIGYKTDILRFPGGSNNKISENYGPKGIMAQIFNAVKEKGYKYFDWDVSGADSDVSGKVTPKERIVQNVLNGVKGKSSSIILLHDDKAKPTTVEALPEIIEALQKDGYAFGVLNSGMKG